MIYQGLRVHAESNIPSHQACFPFNDQMHGSILFHLIIVYDLYILLHNHTSHKIARIDNYKS